MKRSRDHCDLWLRNGERACTALKLSYRKASVTIRSELIDRREAWA